MLIYKNYKKIFLAVNTNHKVYFIINGNLISYDELFQYIIYNIKENLNCISTIKIECNSLNKGDDVSHCFNEYYGKTITPVILCYCENKLQNVSVFFSLTKITQYTYNIVMCI